MNCPSCGHEPPTGSAFCNGCGAKLVLSCPSCGSQPPPGSRFCNDCGASLVDQASTSASPVASVEGGPTRPGAPFTGGASREPRAYTPEHLARKILRSKAALEGERKQVTVMFADVKGSMELAETLDPEEWHRLLERFFEILSECVHRFEGTVNQYTGDGIMALFGAPIAHEDHAQRACHAALELLEQVHELSSAVLRDHGLEFQVRVGLNSGEVVVGRIGDDLRMDYTAQGHTVGLAQRMESLAEPDACFVSDETAALVSGFFRLEDLGGLEVKGASGPIRVHRLLGVGDSLSRFDVARSHGLSRFVGRAAELRFLEEALDQAAVGNGQVVGILAEAGTGKSRLCFEFLERCLERGLRVYQARAVAHGRNIPFLPIIDLFRSCFAITSRDDDRSARGKIAERLASLGEELSGALPLLLDFLGVAEPEQAAVDLGPEARQHLLLGVMRRLVASSDPELPTVTMIEDLHWLDAASDELLGHLVDGLSRTRNLLLVTLRPEYDAEWMRNSWYGQVPLAPLGREATAELLADRLGTHPSLESLTDPVHERTGGNPFFTEEVVQSLVESGRFEGSRGAYRLAEPLDRLEVPESVQAVLAARIDRLPEREKRLLQVASVIGKDFTEPLLAEVAEIDGADLESALAALRRAEFIYEQALFPVAEYTFKHPLTQEVALGSQLHERRRAVHAAVAEALERGDAERLDENASLLAHHWEGAADASRAALWHQRAAAWLAARDIPASGYHWERIRALLEAIPDDRGEVELGISARVQLLSLSWRAGFDPEKVQRLFEEGQALATSVGDPSRGLQVSIAYARARCAVGDVAAFIELAIQNRDSAEALGNAAVHAYALGFLAEALFFAGRHPEALEVVEEGLSRFPPGSVPADEWLNFVDPHLLSVFYRGSCLAWVGRIPEGFTAFEQCREYCDANGMTEPFGYLQSFAAQACYHAYDVERALDCARRAEEISDELGAPPVLVSHARLASAYAHLLSGRSSEAVTAARAALDLHRRLERQLAGWSSTLLATALLQQGDLVAAEEAARSAVETCKSLPWGANEAEAHGTLARALMRRHGEAARGEAEAALRVSGELIESRGAVTLRAGSPGMAGRAGRPLRRRSGADEASARGSAGIRQDRGAAPGRAHRSPAFRMSGDGEAASDELVADPQLLLSGEARGALGVAVGELHPPDAEDRVLAAADEHLPGSQADV